jgi:DtxR family Mn-dependent transcriptional regulator
VLRRHRLVELFLVRIMGMSWSEVHEEAEVLEHAVSDRLIERIDAMLDHPAVDPHGDPIPTAGGDVDEPELASLLSCPEGRRQRVARVTDQRADFLQLLEKHGVMPGRDVRVESRDELTETVRVVTERGGPLQLGFRAASRILVDYSQT